MVTYNDYPMRAGTILGFCNAPTDYLNYIRQDMGLMMSHEILSYIQNHYRLTERRDCDATELALIDILFHNGTEKIRNRKNYCLSQMVTENEEIKATTEDMMAKLAAMGEKFDSPISFQKLLDASSNYMASIFPARASEHFSVKHVGKDDPALLSRIEGSRNVVSFSSESLKFAFADSPAKRKIKEGVYIQIKNEGEVASFIESLIMSDTVFNGLVIDDNLLLTVLSDTKSAELTLPDTLPQMATYGKGDILLLCREKDEMSIVHMGMEKNLHMRRAGKKNKKGKIVFRGQDKIIPIDGDFLLKFARSNVLTPVTVNVSEDMLSKKENCTLNELVSESESSISTICSSSDMVSPYRSGIAQILSAAASQIALGTSTQDISMKTVISCSKNTDPAKIFAHILGIYRAENELCIVSRGNELHVSADTENEKSVSISLAKSCAKASFGEGKLFVISPEEKDGKICFANVRKTFSYVSSLIESGHVIRACALDSKGLSDNADEKAVSPGSFLILTNAELLCCEGVNVTDVGMIGDENAFTIV